MLVQGVTAVMRIVSHALPRMYASLLLKCQEEHARGDQYGPMRGDEQYLTQEKT